MHTTKHRYKYSPQCTILRVVPLQHPTPPYTQYFLWYLPYKIFPMAPIQYHSQNTQFNCIYCKILTRIDANSAPIHHKCLNTPVKLQSSPSQNAYFTTIPNIFPNSHGGRILNMERVSNISKNVPTQTLFSFRHDPSSDSSDFKDSSILPLC